MRVISGTARHRILVTPQGMNTRPTSDKIKETLFNMLRESLYDARFLDLFAGSGQIGIEALSEGAAFCAFCDNDPHSIRCIEKNLKTTGFSERALVCRGNVISALRSMEKLEPFDIVFMDPPYDKGLEKEVLSYLSGSGVITADTLIVVEASDDTPMDYVDGLGYELIREKRYRNNKHIFLERS